MYNNMLKKNAYLSIVSNYWLWQNQILYTQCTQNLHRSFEIKPGFLADPQQQERIREFHPRDELPNGFVWLFLID